MSSPALRFAQVEKRFGRTRALAGLDLEVPRGAFFGLIGPNGAGKTTAFSLACGFLQPDAGQVEILGAPGFSALALKGRVLAMPQDAALGRETRCVEHLLYFASLQGLSAAEARLASDRALDEVGLLDRRNARTKTLSHGMLRRLAIAQALLGTPELVLLDEPTSGLDPRHAHELREVLRRTRAGGRTLVVSSHNLHELEAMCDHVAFIDRGVAVAAGTTDVLTGRGQEVEIELVPDTGGLALAARVREALGQAAAPAGAEARAVPAIEVTFVAERSVLRVVYPPTRAPDEIIGHALTAVLGAGGRVLGVRRGASLEKRFFEMT